MNSRLEKSISKLKGLPDAQQEAVADWLLEELDALEYSQLTADQQAVVDDRLSRPFTIADADTVTTTFERY